MTSYFYESLPRLPSSHQCAVQQPSSWLQNVLSGTYSLPALRTALKAASLNRCGKTLERPDMLHAGRRLYTESLQSMQKAIGDHEAALQDDLLAAIWFTMLYELSDATAQHPDGWLAHLSGLTRLLQHRGPELHRSTTARLILEHARSLIVFRQLVRRQASALSSPAWLSAPWLHCPKSLEQRVFDEGLKLAAVYQQCDDAVFGETMGADLQSIIEGCTSIYYAICYLEAQLDEPLLGRHLSHREEHIADPVDRRNPVRALLLITALGIELGACTSAYAILSTQLKPTYNDVVQPDGCFIDWNSIEMLLNCCRPTARRIMSVAKECPAEDAGALGAVKVILCLRLARDQFDITEPEAAECRVMLRALECLAGRFGGLLR